MKAWMSSDYYSVLGVKSTDDRETIKRAYKSLARQHHPDTGGDSEVFHLIAEAYSVLGNPESREEYDTFQIISGSRGETLIDTSLADLFKEAFKEGYAEGVEQWRKGKHNNGKGNDVHSSVHLTQEEAYFNRGKKTVTIVHNTGCLNCLQGCEKCNNGWVVEERTVTVDIPDNVYDGEKIKVEKEGGAGELGRGDLYITFRIEQTVNVANNNLENPYPPEEGFLAEGETLTEEILEMRHLSSEADIGSETGQTHHIEETVKSGTEKVEMSSAGATHTETPLLNVEHSNVNDNDGNVNNSFAEENTNTGYSGKVSQGGTFSGRSVKAENDNTVSARAGTQRKVPRPPQRRPWKEAVGGSHTSTQTAQQQESFHASEQIVGKHSTDKLADEKVKYAQPRNGSTFVPPPKPSSATRKANHKFTPPPQQYSNTRGRRNVNENVTFNPLSHLTENEPSNLTQPLTPPSAQDTVQPTTQPTTKNTVSLTIPKENNIHSPGKVLITTPSGEKVSFTLPHNVANGSLLRLKAKGPLNPETLKREDLFVKILHSAN